MLSIEEKQEILNQLKKEINKDIEIELCRDIEMPIYAHIGDAGMDVRSAIDIEIKPGETVLIPLGFKMSIPFGYEVQIRPRSGISLNTPLRMPNSIGTIDSGFKDEFMVILNNTSITDGGVFDITSKGNKKGTYIIHKGDRIAQIILCKYYHINFKQVDKIKEEANRGGGFGHSGTN